MCRLLPARIAAPPVAALAAAILVLLFGVCSCGDETGAGGGDARGQDGGNGSRGHEAALRIPIPADPVQLNPLALRSGRQEDFWPLFYPSLLRARPRGAEAPEVTGDLARGWAWDPEAHTLTVRIRGDRRWEDETRVTVLDVARSYAAFQAMGWMAPRAPGDSIPDPGLVSAHALEDSLVRLTYRSDVSFWRALPAATWPILPAQKLADLSRPMLLANPLGREPLSAGPFRLLDWRPGQSLWVGPREDAGGGASAGPRVEFDVCPAMDARVFRAVFGRADVVLDAPVHRLEGMVDGGADLRLHHRGVSSVEMILWNLNSGMARPEIREAVSLAVDRERIVRELLTWRGTVCGGPAGGLLEPSGPPADSLEMPAGAPAVPGAAPADTGGTRAEPDADPLARSDPARSGADAPGTARRDPAPSLRSPSGIAALLGWRPKRAPRAEPEPPAPAAQPGDQAPWRGGESRFDSAGPWASPPPALEWPMGAGEEEPQPSVFGEAGDLSAGGDTADPSAASGSDTGDASAAARRDAADLSAALRTGAGGLSASSTSSADDPLASAGSGAGDRLASAGSGAGDPFASVESDPGNVPSVPALLSEPRRYAPLPRFDRPAAAAVLEAAGWRDDDGDGVREREGIRLRVELFYDRGNDFRERLVTLLEEDLGRAGIELAAVPVDGSTLWSRYRAGLFPTVLVGYRPPVVPDPSALWASWGYWNRTGYASGAVDSLCRRLRREESAAGLTRTGRQIESALRRSGPATFLVYREWAALLTPRVQGFTGSADAPFEGLEDVRLAPSTPQENPSRGRSLD